MRAYGLGLARGAQLSDPRTSLCDPLMSASASGQLEIRWHSLLGEDPATKPAGRDVGHVLLLPACCIHYPRSQCGWRSRPRTTMRAPPLHARSLFASASRLSMGVATRAGSQVHLLLLVRCSSRIYPVQIPASGPYSMADPLAGL